MLPTLINSTLLSSGMTGTPSIQGITQTQWNDFNTTVGGRLFATIPFARPCFPIVAPNGQFPDEFLMVHWLLLMRFHWLCSSWLIRRKYLLCHSINLQK